MNEGSTARLLQVVDLGPTPYAEGIEIQESLAHARAAGETGDWLLFPDHPPVLTAGRGSREPGSPWESLRASPAELAQRGVELYEVSRGGDVTWHGPGQVVGYPIVDLAIVRHDLHRFLRGLEEALIRTVARFGVEGRRWPGRTGIWVGEEKLASIGIAVRRWVSYHGFALNVDPDLSSFDLIHPCGLHGIHMTLIRRLTGVCPPLEGVREAAAAELAREFGFSGTVSIEAEGVRAMARPERVRAAG